MTTTCKCLISRFVEDGNTRQQLFFSRARTLITPAPKTFACIWHIKRDGISANTFDAARIHFLSDVFVAVAVVVSETPFYVVEVGEWGGKKRSARNLVPRAFSLENGCPTQFLRERPWGRGWSARGVRIMSRLSIFYHLMPCLFQVRKLEFLLADALNKKCDTILTCGGTQSNHCRATALAAKQLGLDCYLFLRSSEKVCSKILRNKTATTFGF